MDPKTLGFTDLEHNGGARYWRPDGTLALTQEANGEWRLLDVDGMPTNNTLPADHAHYVLSKRATHPADAVMRAWDYYATAR